MDNDNNTTSNTNNSSLSYVDRKRAAFKKRYNTNEFSVGRLLELWDKFKLDDEEESPEMVSERVL